MASTSTEKIIITDEIVYALHKILTTPLLIESVKVDKFKAMGFEITERNHGIITTFINGIRSYAPREYTDDFFISLYGLLGIKSRSFLVEIQGVSFGITEQQIHDTMKSIDPSTSFKLLVGIEKWQTIKYQFELLYKSIENYIYVIPIDAVRDLITYLYDTRFLYMNRILTFKLPKNKIKTKIGVIKLFSYINLTYDTEEHQLLTIHQILDKLFIEYNTDFKELVLKDIQQFLTPAKCEIKLSILENTYNFKLLFLYVLKKYSAEIVKLLTLGTMKMFNNKVPIDARLPNDVIKNLFPMFSNRKLPERIQIDDKPLDDTLLRWYVMYTIKDNTFRDVTPIYNEVIKLYKYIYN